MLKTLFLDRDGIINEIVMREGVVSSPRIASEFVIREDFLDFYRHIEHAPLRIFIVSNQPDVSRGLIQTSDLQSMIDTMNARFKFTEIVHCVHDDKHLCDCRKPKPGMLTEILRKYELSRDEAIFIGDSYKDILAGKAAGIQTVYLQRDYNVKGSVEPDYVVSKLTEALALAPFSELLAQLQ